MELKSYQRAFLRSQAQQLNPVVYVGKEGFTEGVSSSLDAALTAHELVKVRFSNKKSEVEEISRKLEESTDSTLVAMVSPLCFSVRIQRVKTESIEFRFIAIFH